MKTLISRLLSIAACSLLVAACAEEYTTRTLTGQVHRDGEVTIAVDYDITQYLVDGKTTSSDLAASVSITSDNEVSDLRLYLDDSLMASASSLPLRKELYWQGIRIGEGIIHTFKMIYLIDGEERADSLRTAFVSALPEDVNPSFSGRSDSVSHTMKDINGDSLAFTLWFEYSGSRQDGFTGHPVIRIVGTSTHYRITAVYPSIDNSSMPSLTDATWGLSQGVHVMEDTTLQEGTHIFKASVRYKDDNGIPRFYYANIAFKIGELEPDVLNGEITVSRNAWYETSDESTYIKIDTYCQYTGNLADGFQLTPIMHVYGRGYAHPDTVPVMLVVDGKIHSETIIKTDTFDYHFQYPYHAEPGVHYMLVWPGNETVAFTGRNYFYIGTIREACWHVDTTISHIWKKVEETQTGETATTDSMYMEAYITGNICSGMQLRLRYDYRKFGNWGDNPGQLFVKIDQDTVYSVNTFSSQPTTIPIDISHYKFGPHYLTMGFQRRKIDYTTGDTNITVNKIFSGYIFL